MNVTFSDFLNQLLKERGWRAMDLARATGLSHVAIGNYLGGRTPKYDAAKKIAEAFGITPDYLLNPDIYSAGIKAAAALAESMPGTKDEKTARFNLLVMQDAKKLQERTADWSDASGLQESMPVYGEDWKARALKAESHLRAVKETLSKLTESIKLPEL